MSTLTQFFGGSPIKSIQRGTIYMSNGTYNLSATISSVDTTKTMLNYLGSYGGQNYQALQSSWGAFTLTSSTQVTFSRQSNQDVRVGSYEVIEFY